jgi:hypothetical protein
MNWPKSLRVRLNIHFADPSICLLTKGGSMRWGACEFVLNPPDDDREKYDYWIVAHANAPEPIRGWCAPSNTLFISGEPPSKKIYPPLFYRQFHRIVDTHRLSGHPRVTEHAPGIFWHVGYDQTTAGYRFGYDHLSALARPAKENKIAVVCSDAQGTVGQRRRLALLARLKAQFGDRIVHFGKGFTPINDKMDAFLPCRYNLVLENSNSDHYWTEKLSDAYLSWSHPVYVGCGNLEDYFAANSFTRLDVGDHDGAARIVQGLLAKPETDAEISAVGKARAQILEQYNPFALFAAWAEAYHESASPQRLTLRSHQAFRSWMRGWAHCLGTRDYAGICEVTRAAARRFLK